MKAHELALRAQALNQQARDASIELIRAKSRARLARVAALHAAFDCYQCDGEDNTLSRSAHEAETSAMDALRDTDFASIKATVLGAKASAAAKHASRAKKVLVEETSILNRGGHA